MIDSQVAIQLCYEKFPEGLDALVERLAITVEMAALSIDGWCFQTPDGRRFVRLNSRSPVNRQRFTLAHEVAHFLLKDEPGGLFAQKDIFNPKSQDEKLANDLASELLLPGNKMLELITEPYVDGKLIRGISRKAGASEIAVALRICNLSGILEMHDVAVAHIKDGKVVWKRNEGRNIGDDALIKVFHDASQMPCSTNRVKAKNGHFYQVSSFVNPNYPFVFLHRLNDQMASRPFHGESRKDLEGRLFNGNDHFRNSLNGKISSCKLLVKGMDEEEAAEFMVNKYNDPTRWSGDCHDLFMSRECFDYLIIRLAEFV